MRQTLSFIKQNWLSEKVFEWKRLFNQEIYNWAFETVSAFFTGAMLAYMFSTLKSNFVGFNPKIEK